MDDIIKDILSRVEEVFVKQKSCREFLDKIEAEIRRDWGGDRPYIAKAGESGAPEISQRNAAILRDHRNGERPTFLARKYGISRQRVHEILKNAV
jgi:Mor family transcriptional regulator